METGNVLRLRMSINSINFLTNEKFGSPPSLENFKIAQDRGVKFGLSETHKRFEKIFLMVWTFTTVNVQA